MSHGENAVPVPAPNQVPPRTEIASTKKDLHASRSQIAFVEDQLEAWRQTRLRNGETVQSYEERRLLDKLEVLRLQESNSQASVPGKQSVFEQVPRPAQDPTARSPDTDKNERKEKKGSKQKRNRAKGRSTSRKEGAKSRDSPSRGISPTTGKRSRVRLIG